MNDLPKGARRVVEALDFVARAGAAPSSKEVIDRLAIPRASGYDLLSCLSEKQFLQQEPQGCWVLANEIHALAMSRFGLGHIAQEIPRVLSTLQETTQETARFVVLGGGRVRTTHVFSNHGPVPPGYEIGSETPVNWTVAGRLLISRLHEGALRGFLRTHARPLPDTYVAMDYQQLVKDVRDAKRQGYAMDVEHANRAAASIAAPVNDSSGDCVAVISLLLPAARMRNYRDTLVSLVCSAGARLSQGLRTKK